MATEATATTESRTPLSRERVLRAAVELADEGGFEAISMRRVGQRLGVEAMSLYNHVANKDDLLTGMVDLVVSEIELPTGAPADWREGMRQRALSARAVLMRHRWAPQVIETRDEMTPAMLAYTDSVVGLFLEAGFSLDLTHHAMHTLGSRSFGFTQELFNDSDTPEDPAVAEMMLRQMLVVYPNLAAMLDAITHDGESSFNEGCDDDEEFAFALDLILDGLERMRLREAEAADD